MICFLANERDRTKEYKQEGERHRTFQHESESHPRLIDAANKRISGRYSGQPVLLSASSGPVPTP